MGRPARVRANVLLIGGAIAMRRVRQIGFGLSAALLIAGIVLGRASFAAAAGGASEYASVLQKIFADFDSDAANIKFGGPIAVPLGIVRQGQTVAVRELPPMRTEADRVVHIFYRLEDGSGYIVVRFTTAGIAALWFDRNVEFVAGAIQPYNQPAVALSGAAADKMLSSELSDWETLLGRSPVRE